MYVINISFMYCFSFNPYQSKHDTNFQILGEFWLHIRAVGSWTNMLHDYFEKKQRAQDEGMICGIISFT